LVLNAAKRLVRRWFPRRTHPLLDHSFRNERADEQNERAYRAVIERLEPGAVSDPFIMNRHYEGRRWREVARHYLDGVSRARLLDVGAGNGAIELAFNTTPQFKVFSIERQWNQTAAALHAAAAAPFLRSIADAVKLPFPSASFDAILCIETIEHVRNAKRVGEEMVRVLRPGGIILVTTPPRWRYALAPDPHFGIRGLVLLPHAWQRRIAERRGFVEDHHHVERLFGSAPSIARLFPGCRIQSVLSRSRAPKWWFWDAIVLRKPDA
jgi:SAM-dependent methyltransferase